MAECAHFLRYLNAMEIAHTPLDQGELTDRLGTSLYQVGVHVHAGALVQPAEGLSRCPRFPWRRTPTSA
jgi:hypothetical protein